MHEFSLASEIVDIALSAAGDAGGDVTAVHITMGPRSHLDQSVLADAFQMAAAATPAADATLEIAIGTSESSEVTVTAIDVAD